MQFGNFGIPLNPYCNRRLAWLIILDCSQWPRQAGGEIYSPDLSPGHVKGKCKLVRRQA